MPGLPARAALCPPLLPVSAPRRLTGPGRMLLERVAASDGPVLVDALADGHMGNDVSRRAYDRLERDGLVELGPRVPDRGRPILLTQDGRAALAGAER